MVRYARLICLVLSITCGMVSWTLPAAAEDAVLMMATTTSTDNTGLLDYLAPHFKKATGIDLRWTATGTGKALKLGENCDVDVLRELRCRRTDGACAGGGKEVRRRRFRRQPP
ncbi:MAG: hypothetical protein P8Y74_04115 [Desulfobacterales bacterium]